jgi:hypothetical protein
MTATFRAGDHPLRDVLPRGRRKADVLADAAALPVWELKRLLVLRDVTDRDHADLG